MQLPIDRKTAFLALTVLSSPLASAQVQVPPSIIQQQADREHKSSKTFDRAADRKQLETLKVTALGDDSAVAMTALHTLHSLGDSAKPTLRDVVRQLLARDRAVLDGARGIPAASELRDLSEKIFTERQSARANIDKLAHDQTIKIAHQHYDALKTMWEKLNSTFGQADAISKALSRHGELVSLWQQLMPADKHPADDTAAKLAAEAEKAFGCTAAQLSSIPDLGHGDAPKEPVLRDVWFYRACRRIAAYNATLQKYMSSGEWENAVCVNTYREYLGILPYEIDPRLVESARGHSQEMVSLKYFDHTSPVAANKTPNDRMRNAGYTKGYGENIAYGRESAQATFDMWFDSPGHHQNMARLGPTQLGVGKVNKIWTQNFGSAQRLMLASEDDRKAAFAKAKVAAKE